MEYSPKELFFDEQGRQRLLSGVTKMAAAVKSTLGSSGNTVLIESMHHTHGITVTKDGVTVAKAIELLDPVENLAVRIIREASERTATEAGDGTTTSVVLAEALVRTGSDLMSSNLNRTQVLRHMVDISHSVVDRLRKKRRRVSKAMLSDIATISANNDREIGKIITGIYNEIGFGGVVAVEKSKTTDTYFETTKGLKIDRGYLSPLFINDQGRDECVFEDTYVLVADVEISNLLQIENLLKPIIQDGKKLLIIAPCHANVVNTLAANVMKGRLKACAIAPPSFGYRQHELMQDIAVSVGAKYFSEKTGDDLSLIGIEDLGHADRVVVGKDKTVVFRSELNDEQYEELGLRSQQLWIAHKKATKKVDKDFLLERIASLTGGIGVIYVGGNTDLEQKELYDRVDDAVCAVRSALEEGVVAGGGKALFEIDITKDSYASEEERVATMIIANALKAPLNQILRNAGLEASDYYSANTTVGFGYNVKTGEFGNMIRMGVIDPLKVTRCALQNAVSVAVTILSTNAIITMARSYDTK
jgi:chaperonin GroEL